MNWELFLAAVAIGATTELLMMTDRDDVYRRVITPARVLLVAGGLALIVPDEANVYAVIAFALPHLGRVFGEALRWAIVKVRIGKEQAEWEHQHQTSARDASWSAMPEEISTPPGKVSTRS